MAREPREVDLVWAVAAPLGLPKESVTRLADSVLEVACARDIRWRDLVAGGGQGWPAFASFVAGSDENLAMLAKNFVTCVHDVIFSCREFRAEVGYEHPMD